MEKTTTGNPVIVKTANELCGDMGMLVDIFQIHHTKYSLSATGALSVRLWSLSDPLGIGRILGALLPPFSRP